MKKRQHMKMRLCMKTGLLTAVLLAANILTPAFAAQTIPAKDIQGHWAGTVIQHAIQNGTVTVRPDGLFQPNAAITQTVFTEWTDAAICEQLHHAGGVTPVVLDGIAKGGSGNVTRQQAAHALAALLKLEDTAHSGKLHALKDSAGIPSIHAGAIGALLDLGIFSGYADGSFRPERVLSRAETLSLISRISGYLDAQAVSAAATTKSGMDMGDPSAATTAISFVSLPDRADAQTYEGLIIDRHCFAFRKQEEDSVQCLTMASCAKSGYGLARKAGDGAWSFTQFDSEGQKKAAAILAATTKTKNVTVSATGTVKDGILTVSDLIEKP